MQILLINDLFYLNKNQITIPELKLKLEEITTVPPSQQRLIYLGKVLKDEDKLSDYRKILFLIFK